MRSIEQEKRFGTQKYDAQRGNGFDEIQCRHREEQKAKIES